MTPEAGATPDADCLPQTGQTVEPLDRNALPKPRPAPPADVKLAHFTSTLSPQHVQHGPWAWVAPVPESQFSQWSRLGKVNDVAIATLPFAER
eukprot:1297409-Alexandrium_andersonii.AAC.1